MYRGAILPVLFVLLCTQSVQAATLYMDPSNISLDRGDAAIVSVRLDTDEALGECINAVEGVLTFDGPVQPVDVSIGGSIFSIWIEQPTIDSTNQQVTFAGGIPNGYCGRVDGDPSLTNTLFDVIIRADSSADGQLDDVAVQVEFTNQTRAYLNDGFGTEVDLTLLPSAVNVTPVESQAVLDPWTQEIAADTSDPQEFSIELNRDTGVFSGKYYIVFNTTDKQTGIDRYEIIEEPLSQYGSFTWGQATAPWVEARSPYVLADQTLNSIIRVKAIDKAGNEYIATFIPDAELRTLTTFQIFMIASFGLLILLLTVGVWVKRSRRQAARAFDDVSVEYQDPSAVQTTGETQEGSFEDSNSNHNQINHDQRS